MSHNVDVRKGSRSQSMIACEAENVTHVKVKHRRDSYIFDSSNIQAFSASNESNDQLKLMNFAPFLVTRLAPFGQKDHRLLPIDFQKAVKFQFSFFALSMGFLDELVDFYLLTITHLFDIPKSELFGGLATISTFERANMTSIIAEHMCYCKGRSLLSKILKNSNTGVVKSKDERRNVEIKYLEFKSSWQGLMVQDQRISIKRRALYSLSKQLAANPRTIDNKVRVFIGSNLGQLQVMAGVIITMRQVAYFHLAQLSGFPPKYEIQSKDNEFFQSLNNIQKQPSTQILPVFMMKLLKNNANAVKSVPQSATKIYNLLQRKIGFVPYFIKIFPKQFIKAQIFLVYALLQAVLEQPNNRVKNIMVVAMLAASVVNQNYYLAIFIGYIMHTQQTNDKQLVRQLIKQADDLNCMQHKQDELQTSGPQATEFHVTGAVVSYLNSRSMIKSKYLNYLGKHLEPHEMQAFILAIMISEILDIVTKMYPPENGQLEPQLHKFSQFIGQNGMPIKNDMSEQYEQYTQQIQIQEEKQKARRC